MFLLVVYSLINMFISISGDKDTKKKILRIISSGKYGFASVVSKHKNNSSAAGTLSDSNYGYKTNY